MNAMLTGLGSLLAMLAGLLRDLAHIAVSPSGSAALTGLAAAIPLIRRDSALREKSWRAAFLRQRDPDAAGRTRPRAPSAAPAAASSR